MTPATDIPDRIDFYTGSVIPRRPYLIRLGHLGRLGWNTGRWTLDYLAERAGSQRVKVLHRQDPDGTFLPENTRKVEVLFARFLTEVMRPDIGTDDAYLNLQNGQSVEAPALQLLGDFSIPDFYCEIPVKSINIWMGNSRHGIVTPLHHDFHDNLYVVVEGRKRFTLYPPSQACNLYPRGHLERVRDNGWIDYRDMKTNPMPHLCRVDPDRPDLSAFPGFREAENHRLELELEAGDLLYFPAGWFHQVRSLEGRHIALSFAGLPPGDTALQAMRARFRDPAFIQQMRNRYARTG